MVIVVAGRLHLEVAGLGIQRVGDHHPVHADLERDQEDQDGAELAARAEVRPPEPVFEQPSWDGTIKWLLELGDGQRVEIPDHDDGGRPFDVRENVKAALGLARRVKAQLAVLQVVDAPHEAGRAGLGSAIAKGARAFHRGECAKENVAVRAVDELTLVVDLEAVEVQVVAATGRDP